MYVDSRYRTNARESNSDLKFELNQALDLPDNTVCYVDDISIPHAWRTIESYNNKFYIILKTETINADSTRTYDWLPYVLTIPEGNYNGYRLASGISDFLNNLEDLKFIFEVIYNTATGVIKIEETTVGQLNSFAVPSDFGIMQWEIGHNGFYPWRNNANIVYPDVNNLQSINGVLRNTEMIPTDMAYMYKEYESGFLDLLNIHNIYMHCPNLGHFNSIGARGENSIIKKVPVSSSLGYLILDSVVSPHDKMDVSRQTVKTIHTALKDVGGNVINLHGANYSFSLVFVTTD